MPPRLVRVLALVAAIAMLLPAALATETDQYTVPSGKRFADLGPHFTRQVYDNLVLTTEFLNARIDDALKRDPSGELAVRWYDPAEVAAATRRRFPQAQLLIEGLEGDLYRAKWRKSHPGQVIAHRELQSIYSGRSLLDARQFFTWHFSSTIRVGEVYLGTDKIGHFFDKGAILAGHYYKERARGMSVEEAEASVVELGSGSHPIFSEATLLGWWSSGVYSNADLACDYLGHLFYRNVTEPLMVGGELREPMLVRDGQHWRLNDHVRPDSDFFTVFIDERFDEALNPNLYRPGLREHVLKGLPARREALLAWYADENGAWRSSEWFRAKGRELATYYGRDYGHCGRFGDLVNLGDELLEGPADAFDAVREGDLDALERLLAEDASAATARTRREATLTHLAARDAATLRRVLDAGAPIDAPDEAGRTPLHWAARYGNAEAVALLLDAGAQIDAADANARTPLHDAADYARLGAVACLLEAGSEVEAPDRLGRTPLHLASAADSPDVVAVLLDAGADHARRDELGWAAVHHAAGRGHAPAIAALLAGGADPDLPDLDGNRPLHLAARRGYTRDIDVLLGAGVDTCTPNALGRTPMHEAAFGGVGAIVEQLLALEAAWDGPDALGRTPRQVAQDQRHHHAANLLRLAQLESGSVPGGGDRASRRAAR